MATFTRTFWRDAAERSAKTAAQSTILALGAGAIDVWSVPWVDALGFGLGGAVLSLLTSVASAGAASNGTASLVPEVTVAEPTDDPDAGTHIL
ncbi:holin [Kineosporia succinea]|uniref:Holin n=1 Tax=Kineosporia succinea TaxID=84632 RepID=A0ABT9P9U3_9ACTN|nr:holin [Kineosporia succinea]MDP9829468.1 hypothetical protein [Kineosporia succinea]